MSKLEESKYGITEATMLGLEYANGKFHDFVILGCSSAQLSILRSLQTNLEAHHTAIEALSVLETIGNTYRIVIRRT